MHPRFSISFKPHECVQTLIYRHRRGRRARMLRAARRGRSRTRNSATNVYIRTAPGRSFSSTIRPEALGLSNQVVSTSNPILGQSVAAKFSIRAMRPAGWCRDNCRRCRPSNRSTQCCQGRCPRRGFFEAVLQAPRCWNRIPFLLPSSVSTGATDRSRTRSLQAARRTEQECGYLVSAVIGALSAAITS